MIVDLTFAVLMLLAVVKGYRNGFVIAVFSIIALLVGLAAAIKLSALAADYLRDSVNVSSKLLPVLAFAAVFLLAVLLVRLGAAAIERTMELAMLGWVNKLAGILLYAILYLIIFSVVLFYCGKIHLLTQETVTSSKTYDIIAPMGPRALNLIGVIIPVFKNMFQDLERFFGGVGHKHS